MDTRYTSHSFTLQQGTFDIVVILNFIDMGWRYQNSDSTVLIENITLLLNIMILHKSIVYTFRLKMYYDYIKLIPQ